MENEENKVNEENVEQVKEQVQDTNYDEDKVDLAEYEELNDRYKRMLAEFENYKKRSQKEREGIYGMITGDVVATMLPIMDNLEKAAEAKTDDENYQEGVRLVVRQFAEALKRLGLEPIEAVGKRFNPEFHEAVSHIEDSTKGEQERHSMVIVAN